MYLTFDDMTLADVAGQANYLLVGRFGRSLRLVLRVSARLHLCVKLQLLLVQTPANLNILNNLSLTKRLLLQKL